MNEEALIYLNYENNSCWPALEQFHFGLICADLIAKILKT